MLSDLYNKMILKKVINHLLVNPSFLDAKTALAEVFNANCDKRQGLRIADDRSNDMVEIYIIQNL